MRSAIGVLGRRESKARLYMGWMWLGINITVLPADRDLFDRRDRSLVAVHALTAGLSVAQLF